MAQWQRPQVQLYLEMLERNYGPEFVFEILTNEELLILEQLTQYAMEREDDVSEGERARLRPLLPLIERQWKCRERYRWLQLHRVTQTSGVELTRLVPMSQRRRPGA